MGRALLRFVDRAAHGIALFITACPGDIVDRLIIEQHIRKLADLLDVEEVAFDQYLAREIMENLESDGIPVAAFPQTLANFAKPVDDFENLMLTRQLCHGGNPLLRWAVGNVVMMSDQSGNRHPNKAKAADRMDPATGCNHGHRSGRRGRHGALHVRHRVGRRAVLLGGMDRLELAEHS